MQNDDQKTGAELIAAERQRQIDGEGWTPEQDDGHDGGQMLSAAMCYTEVGRALPLGATKERLFSFGWGARGWPWSPKWWKPSDDPIRNLAKAGALIAAEIDRLQRA